MGREEILENLQPSHFDNLRAGSAGLSLEDRVLKYALSAPEVRPVRSWVANSDTELASRYKS